MSTNEGTGPSRASPPAAPRILPLQQLIRMFKDSVLDKQDVRYCFILGSGASVTSGVPSGAKLADWWLTDLFRDHQPSATEDRLRAWVESYFGDLPDFSWDKRASFYGHIYNRRFPDNASGQTWLRKLMENKQPSFGYTVLARILSQTRHNVVITTNFDNLVHDALTALSAPAPFIAHSHADARFLANHDGKARILKLHGDIDRETYNAASVIDALHSDWHEPLRNLLGSYSPVFIGYGGCDHGLMRFLIDIYAASDARPRPVWSYRVDAEVLKKTSGPVWDPPGRNPTTYAAEFTEKQRAWWVPTPGFDELMLLLGHALQYPHGKEEIRNAAERTVTAYQTSLNDALKAARLHEGSRWCEPLDELTRRAEQALLGEIKRRRWDEWSDYINAAVSAQETISRCHEAIKELPDDPRPLVRLGGARCTANPYDPGVNKIFEEARQKLQGKFAPDSPEALDVRGGWAFVLYTQGEYAAAETEFRAILPIQQRVLGLEHRDTLETRNNIAAMLQSQGKHAEAEVEHRAVLASKKRLLGPEHPSTLVSRHNVANALCAQGKFAEAEAEHRAILAIRQRVLGPEHAETLITRNNLGNALYEQTKYAEAETEYRAILIIYQRVLGLEYPDALTTRNNLATMLQTQGKYAEAEHEHRAVLAIRERVLGPVHPDVLTSCNNLAYSLEALGKKPEALTYARRVLAGRQKTLGEAHQQTQEAQKLVGQLEQSQSTS